MLKKNLKSIANLLTHHTLKVLTGIIILTFIQLYLAGSLQFKFSFDYLLSENNPPVE
ncbi:uncharacterized protein METZ01_LOCUS419515, partial [marine metagenome]